jgi:hypothetical protein
MTLPASAPPTVLSPAPSAMGMPSVPFPRAAVPVALVPIRLPWTRLALVSSIPTPASVFPERVLPAPGAVPPTVLPLAPPRMITPCPLNRRVPPAAEPISLAMITFPVAAGNPWPW